MAKKKPKTHQGAQTALKQLQKQVKTMEAHSEKLKKKENEGTCAPPKRIKALEKSLKTTEKVLEKKKKNLEKAKGKNCSKKKKSAGSAE